MGVLRTAADRRRPSPCGIRRFRDGNFHPHWFGRFDSVGGYPASGRCETMQGNHLEQLVRRFAESAYNDPGDNPVPIASTDATEVIKSQLTENTGTHFLDSGGAYGRHWENNQENPPWEKPEWIVNDGWVTHNLYDYLDRTLSRDMSCVAIEAALYSFAHRDDMKREAWATCVEEFATDLDHLTRHPEILEELGLGEELIREFQVPDMGREAPMRFNTYNQECHTLSQCIQAQLPGGPYGELAFVRVHQGADIRGGYTGPRVYKAREGLVPSELFFRCENCGWQDAESVLYGSDDLIYQSSIDPFELEDMGLIDADDDAAAATIERAHECDDTDGAVFHTCDGGELGHVRFM